MAHCHNFMFFVVFLVLSYHTNDYRSFESFIEKQEYIKDNKNSVQTTNFIREADLLDILHKLGVLMDIDQYIYIQTKFNTDCIRNLDKCHNDLVSLITNNGKRDKKNVRLVDIGCMINHTSVINGTGTSFYKCVINRIMFHVQFIHNIIESNKNGVFSHKLLENKESFLFLYYLGSSDILYIKAVIQCILNNEVTCFLDNIHTLTHKITNLFDITNMTILNEIGSFLQKNHSLFTQWIDRYNVIDVNESYQTNGIMYTDMYSYYACDNIKHYIDYDNFEFKRKTGRIDWVHTISDYFYTNRELCIYISDMQKYNPFWSIVDITFNKNNIIPEFDSVEQIMYGTGFNLISGVKQFFQAIHWIKDIIRTPKDGELYQQFHTQQKKCGVNCVYMENKIDDLSRINTLEHMYSLFFYKSPLIIVFIWHTRCNSLFWLIFAIIYTYTILSWIPLI